MKTRQILKSSDRVLFGITIPQDTNQFLSITALQQAYETARWQHAWAARGVDDILKYRGTQERLYYLLSEAQIIKTTFISFTEMVETEGIVKVLKGLKVWKTSGRGTNKAVFCDPYVWVLLAMEFNPMLYAKVIMWLTDSLVFDRIEAGDEFLPMNKAISAAIMAPDYSKYAKAINTNVFGHHQSGMRNTATARELRRIADIEKFITNAVRQSMLRTEDSILTAIENYK